MASVGLSIRSTARRDRLTFAVDGSDGFGAYHDLYASGTTVSRTEGPFSAAVKAYRFPHLLLFDRSVAGAAHHRTPDRVRRDGFDHINLQVLKTGGMAAGRPGDEQAMRPGDIVVFDTVRPQRTFVEAADYVSLAIAREAITDRVPDVGRLHGIVLAADGAGLLSDFLLSLGKHSASLSPAVASESAAMAGTLLGSAISGIAPDVVRKDEPPATLEMLRWRGEAYIDAHLEDRDLDVDRVAAGIGVSRTRLYAAFAPVSGVARHILERRVQRMSMALLRPNETRSIATLAFDFGFADESHCNRAFKAAYGSPPGQFRAESRRVETGSTPALKAGGWSTWWDAIS